MTEDGQAERPIKDGQAERPARDGQAKRPATDREAEKRLWLLTLVRLAGIGAVVAGLGVVGRSGGEVVALIGGLALMGGGGALSLLGPRWLARRWNR
jgi:hypothetical protein